MKDFESMIAEAHRTIKDLEKKELQINYKAKSISINAKINFNQTTTAQVHVNLQWFFSIHLINGLYLIQPTIKWQTIKKCRINYKQEI